jgi:Flp pilus assembly protein TadD
MIFNQTRNQKPETRNFFLLIPLALIGMTLAVFWPVGGHDFLNYDDDIYVTENPHVQKGLTVKGLLWAFGRTYHSNWHPLAFLSHMIDVSLFGMNPAGHHWMNLLLHLANILLLFFLLRRMTDALWPSVLVAALFAIHPLHAGPVAWVATRDDLLSTFFGLLAFQAYAGYVEKNVSSFRFQVSSLRPESRKAMLSYLAVLLFFTLSLLAKPMLVTLPFLLLLLDYWPLRRVSSFKFLVSSFKPGTRNQKPETRNVVLEKLPLFLLAIVFSLVTLLIRKEEGSLVTLETIPLGMRLENALVSYVGYLAKTFWPHNLSVFYPHPGDSLPVWKILGSAVILLLVSVGAVRNANRRPYLIVGWLWYLGTLLPVIGIVQTGAQAMADRYSYVPLIGIFIMVVWFLTEPKVETLRGGILAVSAASLLLLLGIAARVQVGYWKNSITVFEHALAATRDNHVAHNNLGLALKKQGRLEEAAAHFNRAIAIRPTFAQARNNLAGVFMERKRMDAAAAELRQAVTINPEYAPAHYNLGLVLAEQGRPEEAIAHFRRSLEIDPEDYKAHGSLGLALANRGQTDEAIAHYGRALSINPDDGVTHNNFAVILFKRGKLEEAAIHFTGALRSRPDDPLIHYNLGTVYDRLGRAADARGEFEAALRIKPDFAEARKKLENK